MKSVALASRTKMEIKFAENLKSLRKSKGLSQKELADIVGVDQRTVSAWETKTAEPSLDMLAKLCEIFGETFDGLLG
ncbi:MAG: helix-turn-helix transcriptional regulator [Clostridia bacterium]|nr:helix-turn-helix transcriptional regulator [Clostridia bacterium]